MSKVEMWSSASGRNGEVEEERVKVLVIEMKRLRCSSTVENMRWLAGQRFQHCASQDGGRGFRQKVK